MGSLPTSASKKRSFNDSDDAICDPPDISFKIVFPSRSTVENSLPGPGAFGTIFAKTKDFRATSCPREVFHDCRSGKGKITEYPMHSKIMTVSRVHQGLKSVSSSSSKEIIVLDSDEEAEEAKTEIEAKEMPLYRYLGSHNFTAAAWGKLVKNGTKLMINNYEVGLLLPEEVVSSGDFVYTYHRPPERYSPDDEPWDQTVFFESE